MIRHLAPGAAVAAAVSLLAVGGVLAVGGPAALELPGPGDHVARVVDGDTFTTSAGDKVRVLVMDACESSTPAGPRATAQARRLLEDQDVTLTAEPGHDRDRYGRALRYVTLPDGRDFAEVMLAENHTAVYGKRSDASPERVAAGRAADRDGRDCDQR